MEDLSSPISISTFSNDKMDAPTALSNKEDSAKSSAKNSTNSSPRKIGDLIALIILIFGVILTVVSIVSYRFLSSPSGWVSAGILVGLILVVGGLVAFVFLY